MADTISASTETITANEQSVSARVAEPQSLTASTESVTVVGITIGTTSESSSDTITIDEPAVSIRREQNVSTTMSTESVTVAEGGGSGVTREWSVGGANVTTRGSQKVYISEFEVKHDTLTLTWVAHVNKLYDLRIMRLNAGDYEKQSFDNGDFEGIDTSYDDGNTFTISPPKSLVPPLLPRAYVVKSYNEQASTTGNRVTVKLELLPIEPREPPIIGVSQSADVDEWEFEFVNSTIAVEFVEASKHNNSGDVEFEARLTATQAHAILRNLQYVDASVVISVDDGDDFIRDNSDSMNNTVTIIRPSTLSNSWFPQQGNYVVRSWNITYDSSLDVFDLQLTARIASAGTPM